VENVGGDGDLGREARCWELGAAMLVIHSEILPRELYPLALAREPRRLLKGTLVHAAHLLRPSPQPT
jgi:hypothetical protein